MTTEAAKRAAELVDALKPFALECDRTERIYGELPAHQYQFGELTMQEFINARLAFNKFK